MSHSDKSHSQPGRQTKRAQFSGPAATHPKRKFLPLIIISAIGVGAYVLGSNLSQGPEAATVVTRSTSLAELPAATMAPPAEAPAAGGDIAIPIADVDNGKAKFFRYTAAGGKTVRFFAMKSSDGVYRAELDTCDVCYAAKKGYFQDGDDMVCRKCSRRFPSALINDVSGGCNPVPLTRTVQGDKLIVKASDLESGTTYF